MASIGENERFASLSKIETALTRNGVKKLERECLTSIVLQKTWIAGEVAEFSINFYAEARKQKGKLYLFIFKNLRINIFIYILFICLLCCSESVLTHNICL